MALLLKSKIFLELFFNLGLNFIEITDIVKCIEIAVLTELELFLLSYTEGGKNILNSLDFALK